MGKKKANKKLVEKLSRVRTRSASSPEQINRASEAPQSTPAASAMPSPRAARSEPETTVPTRLPAQHGLVRLCQFLRDHSGAALVVPKKTV